MHRLENGHRRAAFAITILLSTLSIAAISRADESDGLFSNRCDVGDCAIRGSTVFDSNESTYTTASGRSMIYTLPIQGGQPVQITQESPSYWHGWSPDGQTLVYCAQRGGDYDVYAIPVGGGQETRLTNSKGLDDGPEYSPDGKTIYFNSARTGAMKIWKMQSDGSQQTQVTFDEYQDWFAHPSPDGKWLVFVSYDKEVPAESHPANKDVMIRLLSTEGGPPRTLAKLFGGQGTMNVPSWSPDSTEIAFVSYRLIHAP